MSTQLRNESPPSSKTGQKTTTTMPNEHFKVEFQANELYNGPDDLDELFNENLQHEQEDDDGSLFDSDDEKHQHAFAPTTNKKYFVFPNKRLLDENDSLILGSPFSEPSVKKSNRPSEPSSIAFLIRIRWVVGLTLAAALHFDTIRPVGS
jgi:hypothetical protein